MHSRRTGAGNRRPFFFQAHCKSSVTDIFQFFFIQKTGFQTGFPDENGTAIRRQRSRKRFYRIKISPCFGKCIAQHLRSITIQSGRYGIIRVIQIVDGFAFPAVQE